MLRFFVVLCTLLFVASCGSSSQGNITVDGTSTVTYETEQFSVLLPSTWTSSGTIDNLPIPAHGSVVMAAISPTTKYNFSNNFIILEDNLLAPASSESYSVTNNQQTVKKYIEYTPVSNEAIIFSDDDHSRVYVFDAKYNSNTPRMRFIQTAKACGTTVYLLHISISLDRNASDYIPLMKTFACK